MSANAACAAKMLHYTAGKGRLDVEICWSKLVRVGFYIGLRWPSESRIIFTEDSMGEECDIDGRKMIYHIADG